MRLKQILRTVKSEWQRIQAMTLPPVSRYKQRFVFIAGLPKAGTTWMENLVETIPHYRRLAPFDPRASLDNHVLDRSLLQKLPGRGNYFLKTHVEAYPEGVAALIEYQVPTLVMVRDLRDQCVSRFYHVLNQPEHRHHDFYIHEDHEVAFKHCIEVSITEYAAWIRGWLNVIETRNMLFKMIRFEDMRSNTGLVFREVLEHFSINLDDETIEEIIQKVALASRKSRSLKQGIKSGTNTFRSGKIGEWREHFSSASIEYFKSQANDVLVDCGYETSENWS